MKPWQLSIVEFLYDVRVERVPQHAYGAFDYQVPKGLDGRVTRNGYLPISSVHNSLVESHQIKEKMVVYVR